MLRRTAGVSGVLAFTAAGLAGAATAHADDFPIRLSLSPSVVELQPYDHGGPSLDAFRLSVDNPGGSLTEDVTYTYDFGGLAGIADASVTPGGLTCTTSGAIETCHGTQTLPHGRTALAPVRLTSVRGNKIGDKGTVKVTARADGVTFTSAQTQVQVSGPEFEVAPSVGSRVKAKVGDVRGIPLGIVNRGTYSRRVLLEMDVTDGLDFVTKYSNCEYAKVPKRTTSHEDTWTQPVTEALCEIEGPFEEGLYGYLADAVRLRVTKHALADGFHYQVFDDTASAMAGLRGSGHFTRGTGGRLTMGTLNTVHSDNGDNETDTWSGHEGSVVFETPNTADFAAVGGAVSGRVGDTVKAVVGYTDKGPAWFGASNTLKTTTTFTVPDGAEVVHKPAACTRTSGEHTAPAVYSCLSHTSVTAGGTVSYTFTLKIAKAVTNAPGSVEVAPPGVFEDGQYKADTNPGNNTATFVLTGRAGGGNAPGAQGQGGELADTGAAGLGTIGGGALLVLAAGGGLWTVSRRRRARA